MLLNKVIDACGKNYTKRKHTLLQNLEIFVVKPCNKYIVTTEIWRNMW